MDPPPPRMSIAQRPKTAAVWIAGILTTGSTIMVVVEDLRLGKGFESVGMHLIAMALMFFGLLFILGMVFLKIAGRAAEAQREDDIARSEADSFPAPPEPSDSREYTEPPQV